MLSAEPESFVTPSIGVSNDGYDNENGVMIVRRNQVIKSPNGEYYSVLENFGNGQYGSVYEVVCMSEKMINPVIYAMKITRSQEKYREQAKHEISVHEKIQYNATKEEMKSIVKMITAFDYHNHMCIVTEALSMDLYRVLQYRDFKGLPIFLVKEVVKQLLQDLVVLQRAGIVHGDIKPENVMLADGHQSRIKLIDFGSAQFDGYFTVPYFQSRYYRAPEVVLNLPYDYKVDIWSAACVAIEMFVSYPVFGGQNEHHLLQRIVQLMGPIPKYMIEESPKKNKFFDSWNNLKTLERYCSENKIEVPKFEEYLYHNSIDDLIMQYKLGLNKQGEKKEKEITKRKQFVDLVKKMLTIDPDMRPSAEECLLHPFITT